MTRDTGIEEGFAIHHPPVLDPDECLGLLVAPAIVQRLRSSG
jgi:hypothetical protein